MNAEDESVPSALLITGSVGSGKTWCAVVAGWSRVTAIFQDGLGHFTVGGSDASGSGVRG